MTATPGQTIGPFFGFALPYAGSAELVPPGRPEAIRLHGRVLDGAGEPVPDALIELSQADPSGRLVRRAGSLHRDGFDFTGWGRAETDAAGRYRFSTLVPAAPFFALVVFGRGLTDRLFTRAYLPDAAEDPFLASVDPARRGTLRVRPDAHGFVFDIRLQGDGETVFLAYPRH